MRASANLAHAVHMFSTHDMCAMCACVEACAGTLGRAAPSLALGTGIGYSSDAGNRANTLGGLCNSKRSLLSRSLSLSLSLSPSLFISSYFCLALSLRCWLPPIIRGDSCGPYVSCILYVIVPHCKLPCAIPQVQPLRLLRRHLHLMAVLPCLWLNTRAA